MIVTDATQAVAAIAAAKPYAEFDLVTERGTVRLMARDYPRAGRRCTNLTHGTEWFVDADGLARVGFVRLVPLTPDWRAA